VAVEVVATAMNRSDEVAQRLVHDLLRDGLIVRDGDDLRLP